MPPTLTTIFENEFVTKHSHSYHMNNFGANRQSKLVYRLILIFIGGMVLSCRNDTSAFKSESLYEIELGLLQAEFGDMGDTCMICDRILINTINDSNLYDYFQDESELEPLLLNRLNGVIVDSEDVITNSRSSFNEVVGKIHKTDLHLYQGTIDDLYNINLGHLDTINGEVVFVPNFNVSHNVVFLCHLPVQVSDELYLVRSNVAFSGSSGHYPVTYRLYSFKGKEWEFVRKVYGGVGIN